MRGWAVSGCRAGPLFSSNARIVRFVRSWCVAGACGICKRWPQLRQFAFWPPIATGDSWDVRQTGQVYRMDCSASANTVRDGGMACCGEVWRFGFVSGTFKVAFFGATGRAGEKVPLQRGHRTSLPARRSGMLVRASQKGHETDRGMPPLHEKTPVDRGRGGGAYAIDGRVCALIR